LDLELQEKAEELVLKNAESNEKLYDANNQSLLSVDTSN
jgi:hypothetical protein